jgi:phosphatidylserine decarboxylase
MNPLLTRLIVLPQHVVPQRALSNLVNWLTRLEGPFVPPAIRAFCAAYRVDLDEALDAQAGYRSFNRFFTRALRADARPVDATPGAVVSPADGAISQLGTLMDGVLLQAKGRSFSALALLAGDDALDAQVRGGRYAIVYLSPRDYHRVHAPFDCTVRSVSYVPGRLFSVNDRTSQVIQDLYARNERVVLACDSEWGPCAIVMVGAMLVSSMELTCCALPALARDARGANRLPLTDPAQYARGAELGRFNMGSTVILLLPPGAPAWKPGLANGVPVRMGENLSVRSGS